MAHFEVEKLGSTVLRKKAQRVDKVSKRIAKMGRDMLETMYASDGVGLAAPQIGESIRLIVVDVGNSPFIIVNPEIVESSGISVDVEGCLSLPGVSGYVDRYSEVTVEGLDEKGKPLRVQGSGFFARALQHEIDHLDGILFIDKASGLSGLDKFKREHRLQVDGN